MTHRPVLSEWAGDALVYVSPGRTLQKFGYAGLADRGDVAPEERALYAKIESRVSLQDGATAPEPADLGTPLETSGWAKAVAGSLGADMVGITRVDPHYVYDGFDLNGSFAIVFAVAMDYEGEILELPRRESNVEYLRVYEALSLIGVRLAEEIRAAGYAARAHTLRDEQLAMLPHARNAGLGELGKHGSLINRELGCSFRVGVVTTELELAEDAPHDEGIQTFCSSCRMCVSYCPGGAISDEMDVVRGAERWIVDTAKCAPHFATHYACAICIQVCPINAKAFGGRFRDAYVRKMQELDPVELIERLTAALPTASDPDPPAGSPT